MVVGDAHVFPGFLPPVLTQLFFPKPATVFLTCFCRGERRKYAGKKFRLNWGSNSQPPGRESNTLTTEPFGQGLQNSENSLIKIGNQHLILLTLSLKCQFWALPIQQQIKIWCQKYGQIGIQLSDLVENIVGKEEIVRDEQFLLFSQCFQKFSVVNASKWVSME